MSSGEDLAAQGEPQYVLHCYSATGERLPPEVLDAQDDYMAIDLVRLQLHKHCTLWRGERLVFSLPEFA